VQQSSKFGVASARKRSVLFRALGFLPSILLVLASLPEQVIAHSAHLNDGPLAVIGHLDARSHDAGDLKSHYAGNEMAPDSRHCVSVIGCLSCLPTPEQVLQVQIFNLPVEFTRILVYLGPTLEQEFPPPRL